MWWRIGRPLNTLNYQIGKTLQETTFKNAAFREHRWNWIEAQFVTWSRSPIQYTISLSVVFLLSAWSASLFAPYFKGATNSELIGVPDSDSWQGVILTAQATIIGVIFPLVIGFVGVLLQRKSADRALWHIYHRYSAFLFVGFSSLALIFLIECARFFYPSVSLWGHQFSEIAIGGWFLFNLLLVAWFIYSTFRFVANDSRSDVVLRFCINETLISEVATRLSTLIPANAAQLGLIGASNDVDAGPEVLGFVFSRPGDSSYRITFRRKKFLRNVYFRLLAIGVRVWKITLASDVVTEGADRPAISLPVRGRARPRKQWDICVTNPRPLPSGLRLFLRMAYSFGTRPAIDHSPLAHIVQALTGGVQDALRTRNLRQYKDSLDELEKWHVEILLAAAFVDSDGELDNWLLLPDQASFGRSFADELAGDLYELTRLVVERLSDSEAYFRSLCYYFVRVYGFRNPHLPLKLIDDLMASHYRVWCVLLDWTEADTSKSHPEILRTLDSAVRSYVGSWEAWLQRFASVEAIAWSNALMELSPYISHLEYSSMQLITALERKSIGAAEWAADLLIGWLGTALHSRQHLEFGWQVTLVDHTHLGLDQNSAYWRAVTRDQEFNAGSAIGIALGNAWKDVRLLTASYVLTRDFSAVQVNVFQIINALLDAQRLKPGSDSLTPRLGVTTAADVLESYMRQRQYWAGEENGYEDWLNKLVSAFSHSGMSSMVSGRLYSGWGSANVRSLTESFACLALSRSAKQWRLSNDLIELIRSNFLTYEHRDNISRDLEEKWLNLNAQEVELARQLAGIDDITERLENFRGSIRLTVEELRNQNEREVLNAPIDQERLDEFGRFASASAFILVNGNPPLRFFEDVEFVDALEEPFRRDIRVQGFKRSNIARDVEINRAVNEAEWLDSILVNQVSTNLYQQILAEDKYTIFTYADVEATFDAIAQQAQFLTTRGLHPLLLIGPKKIDKALDATLWPHSRRGEVLTHKVWRELGHHEGYKCHVEGVEVYSMPFSNLDRCILIPREILKLARFRRFADGRYVEVEFVPSVEDESTGSLVLTYWAQAVFKDEPAFMYKLKDKPSVTNAS